MRRERLEQLRDSHALAQSRTTDAANMKRAPVPAYKPGDIVLLDARDIKTTRLSKKLDHKFLGPFKVTRPIGRRSYELELTTGM